MINRKRHNSILKERAGYYSKYPPAVKIDIHVDDSKGVEMEGERYNYKTIIVAETDTQWTEFEHDSE